METIRIMLSGLLFVVFSGCNGLAQKENASLAEAKEVMPLKWDSLTMPKIDVKVNRQYDEKGNIVRFDSTYSYFYSGPRGSMHRGNDSVFSSFGSFFERSYPDIMGRYTNDIFFSDSLFKYDFFSDDYFRRRFDLNTRAFESMYQQMDSIKSDFLKRNYPNGYQKRKTM